MMDIFPTILAESDGVQRVHLDLTYHWPTWVWLLAIVLIGWYVYWSYRGLVGNHHARGLLAIVRFLILLGLIILIAGPTLVTTHESVQRDWVVMLLDRSQSLEIADVKTPNRITRDEQLQQVLSQNTEVFASLADKHQIKWMGFDTGSFDLEIDQTTGLVNTPEPTGDATDINAAFDQVIQKFAGQPLSGIVIFSDGRSTRNTAPNVINRLEADRVPVCTVPLGSREPIGDRLVRSVDAPSRAYVRDRVPIQVLIESFSGTDVAPNGFDVVLIDDQSGETQDRVHLSDHETPQWSEPIVLIAKPKKTGRHTWTVRIETNNDDLIPDNNEMSFSIELVDQPLRVLYIEGYPRWEYRYLKNMLVREPSIDSSIMLMSADREFAQEGDSPITRLPNTTAELEPYDVIIIGDVSPTVFSTSQIDMIRRQVAENGAGVLWIAGQRAVPNQYARSELSILLPMIAPADTEPIIEPITIQPTRLAERLGVLDIQRANESAWPILSDPTFGWTRFQWAWQLNPSELKPTVETLAETIGQQQAHPMATHMRYGAGRAIFIATDEIWRWRYERGETFPEQFWIQIIRMLGRDRITTSSETATLSTTPKQLETGQSTILELRVFDSKVSKQLPPEIGITITNETMPNSGPTRLSMTAETTRPGRYRTMIQPDLPGTYHIRPEEPLLSEVEATFEAYRPDSELKSPNGTKTDHDQLKHIANQTGGLFIKDTNQINQFERFLPDRSIQTSTDTVQPIWDTPWIFIFFLILLTTEWVGRRLIRLA